MAIADFDGAGHLDFAVCHEKLGCFVYLNDGKGKFGGGIQFQKPGALPYSMFAADLNPDNRPIYKMAAGDLNGDERPDVVVARSGAPSFVMFNHPPKN